MRNLRLQERITTDFFVSLILTLLAYLPGLIFSVFVIARGGLHSRGGDPVLNEPLV